MDIVNLTFKNNDRSRTRSNSASRSRSPVRRDQSPVNQKTGEEEEGIFQV